ncbi:MAG: FecR domain-containing protein [Bacteroidota bacterium]
MKKNPMDDTFLARWLNGQLTEEELAEFESYEDFQTYKKIVDATDELEMPKRDKEAGWEALHQKMDQRTAKTRRLNTWWKYAAAAAIVCLVGYFAFFPSNDWETHSAAYAQQTSVVLPDGSKALLNAGSDIRFNRKTYEQRRTIDLQGEVFFEVIPGAEFTVKTPNGEVRVLGTSFNVRSRENKIEVACFTGKVGLSFDGFQAMELIQPGDRVVAKDQQIVQKSTAERSSLQPGWAQGEAKFVQAAFIEVIEEFKRQFDIEIEYPSELLEYPAYTGGFPINDLEAALQIVFSSAGYRYSINGNKVVLSK